MAEEPSENTSLLNLSAFSQVRLGPGVIGRTAFVAAVGLAALGLIGYSMSGSPSLQLAVCLLILAGGGAYLWQAFSFANRHPQTSMLEGADLVRWRQIEMAANNQPPQVPTANVAAPQMIESKAGGGE